MTENNDPISRMRAITISREYGSGGGEIAARLTERLGWQLIDHEVVVRVAQELGVTIDEAEAHDERTEGLVARILTSMQAIEPAVFVNSHVSLVSNERVYRDALRGVVEAAVDTGHVVIVGRGSQVLLANWRDVLHVRIIAPFEQRVAYVMRREGLNQATASSRIQLKERDRKRYLQAEHGQIPQEPHLYDLVINTAVLDLDSAVDLIVLALERKAGQLTVPSGELGPAAGMTRYPTEPHDLHPPESITESSER
jgi:cytidylate kinase